MTIFHQLTYCTFHLHLKVYFEILFYYIVCFGFGCSDYLNCGPLLFFLLAQGFRFFCPTNRFHLATLLSLTVAVCEEQRDSNSMRTPAYSERIQYCRYVQGQLRRKNLAFPWFIFLLKSRTNRGEEQTKSQDLPWPTTYSRFSLGSVFPRRTLTLGS